MILAAVLAVALVAVIVAAALALRAARRRADAIEAERARVADEAAALRKTLGEREREVAELRPYRGLVEDAGDWIWTTDADGTITFSNAVGAALLGRDDLVGTNLAELTHPDDRAALVEADGWAGVIRRVHADGSLRTTDARWVTAGDGFQGIDRDLTSEGPARRVQRGPAKRPHGEPPGVAVVRWPVVDGRREVVGYELIGGGSVLGAFAPDELVSLGAGRPVWVSLNGAGVPEFARDKVVLQLPRDAPAARAAALAGAGFALAVDDYEGGATLLEQCGIVKVRTPGRDDEELRALIAEPAERGLVLVATGVATHDEFTRCQVLGFSHFQGDFFARPAGERDGAGHAGVASLQALAELTASEASFEDLERIIGADVGLSIALLRHVNSAFFSLPRKIESVHEALTLLGSRAVRRWATVIALSSLPEAPDQLVALALLRARMCELLGGDVGEDERDKLFTLGLFSVADALLDASMEEVLESLPLSDEMQAALLHGAGPRGELLSTVLRYERGHFPEGVHGDPVELADAYLRALKWADDAGRWLE